MYEKVIDLINLQRCKFIFLPKISSIFLNDFFFEIDTKNCKNVILTDLQD